LIGENETTGISSKKIKVNEGYLKIIFGKDRQEYFFTIPVLIPKIEGCQLIIGRLGFFEQFKITFCEAEERIIFKKSFKKQKYY